MNNITYCSKKNFAFYKNLCITSKFNITKIKQNNNNNLEDFIEIDDNVNNYKKFIHEPIISFNKTNNKQPKDFTRLINTNSLLYKVDQNVSELQYLEQLYQIIEIK
tara:strand:+ start:185 stop:502 length:318 start_codon:yes stop_codon:yes gene_type:complete